MRRIISITLILMIPVLICANAIMGNQGELPLFANHIVKIQLSQEADTIANLGKEYRTLSPSFGIDELDELAASLGEHQLIRAHIRMEDRAYEEEVGFDRWVILEYKERIDVMEAVKTFKDRKRWVDDACPEYIRYPAVVPNDPWNTSNWGHNNTGNNGPGSYGSGTPGFDSSAHLAWDQAQGYGTSDIIIAIIDSGVDINHPDLRLMAGYDYGDNDSDPMDDSGGGQNSPRGHGTACAGIAAGIANNGIGVSGIAGGCTVMPLKAADSDGYLYDSYIINAITHARNNGAHIISLSLGGEGQMGSAPAFDNALTYAYNAGITIFAAIGNGNASSILYPANHNKVIAVGAASPSGQRKSPSSSDGQYWWGSNYGVNTQDNTKA
ncbi:MAG: S8 family serine peptidase, partial [Candidatus Cloacimonetes bacterium]|nr:S8 family serine peptidase [Candidatus Cloacimonadota bacterium]